MLGLLQAYGSDEDSDSDDERETDDVKPEKDGQKLPNPFEASTTVSNCSTTSLEKSVFINPYVAADDAKKAILEKHVKMTSTDIKSVNGKRICWNYRKNKCRFGHNCKYAHDSDLQPQPVKDATENQFTQVNTEHLEIVDEATILAKGKKRPGLSSTINPSKKVMKMYNKQKQNV